MALAISFPLFPSCNIKEKTGDVSLELLMPTGIVSILKDKSFVPDELSMSIVKGLCVNVHKVLEDTPVGPRVRVC